MKQLILITKRQQYILRTLEEFGRLSNRKLFERTQAHFDKTSRVTLIRDLNKLLEKKLIQRFGKGRGIFYESAAPRILRVFRAEEYFQKEPDQRSIEKNRIDFSRLSFWKNLFTKEELEKTDILTRQFQKRLDMYPLTLAKKELERITIEFSWRSSHIEGDTYSLLETERLIKEHREARGKTHEEALMILNHKAALEYVWKHSRYFQKISLRKIEEIHDLIVKDLNIAKGLRKKPVGIIGTKYMPYDNTYQIRESMETLCHLMNSAKPPFLKAAIATAGLSYIQPFEDGNKRTSRLLGNALLLAFRYCPLSYRSIDEIEYKKAMILFYEQHTLFLFKKLFMEQYEFAVGHYFL